MKKGRHAVFQALFVEDEQRYESRSEFRSESCSESRDLTPSVLGALHGARESIRELLPHFDEKHEKQLGDSFPTLTRSTRSN